MNPLNPPVHGVLGNRTALPSSEICAFIKIDGVNDSKVADIQTLTDRMQEVGKTTQGKAGADLLVALLADLASSDSKLLKLKNSNKALPEPVAQL